MESKQQLRMNLRQQRDGLTEAEVRQWSAEICEILQSEGCFLQAEAIYFYYPLGKEADLLALAETALTLGKHVAFPRVSGMDMEFYQVQDLTEFTEGAFHVMEPFGNEKMCREEPLVLVPGLAFDSRGGRMGYGKGYYDRYFARYPGCRKIGVCYEFQKISEVPCEPHDIFMDGAVTQQGLLFC